ncbi:hypothetical protein ACFQAV_07675 [Companilactobacillus huachuanensis]|uniref:DUF2798 domain-containing protein n=1 Tax=Companilactobacillus huachuanensis TaxID=2559914 RepID=A0ABW1RNB9_9LACO|nr:hypothetical protein [Companilactobacillus huachuanensis]
MEFQQRLPQNLKQTILFMAVISIISVNLIAPIITGLEIGFSVNNYLAILPRLPFIWLVVIALVVLTQKPAEALASHFLGDQPNFRGAMLITAMCNVFLMSLILTIVGAWIGTGHVSMDVIMNFPRAWPRNYTIALIVEAFIAQPIARSVMSAVHGSVAVQD